MANITVFPTSTIPKKITFRTTGRDTDVEQMKIQLNNLIKTVASLGFIFTSDGVLRGTTLSTGTTNTMASSACTITIGGTPVVVAATTAQALSGGSALPAGKWTCFGVDAVAAGTITQVFSSTMGTGQASEAAAITDALTNVTKTAAKARIGYITVQAAAAATWTPGTDGLALGSGGTVAQATNFYNIAGPFQLTADSANAILLGSNGWLTSLIANQGGTVALSAMDP